MKMLVYVYLIGIFVIISLYAFLQINLIWLVGYLLILLFAELVPKKIIIESVVALALLGLSLLIVGSGSSQYAPLPISFLLISTGLPGIIVYTATTMLFQGSKAVAEITLLSSGMVLLLIGLHAVKFIINRVLWPILLIPIIDLLPIIIDLVVVIAMSYIVFTHVQTLYPTVQNFVKLIIGKI
ncbi:hypothetical protein IHE51_00975 [Candidatus Parvarchaeota archaeon]|uniref:Uncharacterized protein n=1 Tax=Candidatus Acidifodinimicrobium mancum TaxID=2898728 RepID=A0A8T3V094_9ARCH|nr:hypothetical protein [Candidatus Acidifodinimicrobium mancum]MBE5730166.1 hypothetical protein [Candidatus Acidifodinimicrobium mancum]